MSGAVESDFVTTLLRGSRFALGSLSSQQQQQQIKPVPYATLTVRNIYRYIPLSYRYFIPLLASPTHLVDGTADRHGRQAES
jgi:hypothetical protein